MLQPAYPLTTKTTAPITLAPTSTLSCRHSRTQEQQQQQNHCRTKPPKWNHSIAAVDLVEWSHYAIAAVDLVEWSHYVRRGTIGTIQYHRSHDCSSRSCRMEPFVELNCAEEPSHRTIRSQPLILSNGATTCVEEPSHRSHQKWNHVIAAVALLKWSHLSRNHPIKATKTEPFDCSY